MLRERVPPLREPVPRDDFAAPLLRDDFAAPPVARLAVDFAADLRAVDARLEPVADFARVDEDFFAPPAERDAVDRFAAERELDALRAPVERAELPADADAELVPPLLDASIDHLPLITRWAASATASAMIDPSLVALDTTLLAACDAESAASSPASRIFLRAAGLAASAAAAAVSPAASISLLIAALASLSTVVSLERERDEPELERDLEELEREELFRADFAIASSPSVVGKTL